MGWSLNLSYLHGDTDEEEEIKFKQTDDNLIPSVHRCGGGYIRSHGDKHNENCLPFMAGFAPTMWKMAQLPNNNCEKSISRWRLPATYPNSPNSTLVHHSRLSQAAAMTHGAAISNGRTFAKRVPLPPHSWVNRRQYVVLLCEKIDRRRRSAGFRCNHSLPTPKGLF